MITLTLAGITEVIKAVAERDAEMIKKMTPEQFSRYIEPLLRFNDFLVRIGDKIAAQELNPVKTIEAPKPPA